MELASLTINTPAVVHETIDGETIAIHMATGTYYSLDGTAAAIWSALEAGAEREALLAELRERYGGDPAFDLAQVTAFLDELVEEGLVVEGASGAAAVALPDAAQAFTSPTLNKYTDMQEFMLVDPIHDVDEGAGWPHAKAG